MAWHRAVRVFGLIAALSLPLALGAQQQKQRTIDGTVRTAGGQPAAGAIVYLKNNSTLAVKTFITTADGAYRFGQVGMDADYQLWAESDGHKSNNKTISNFDTKSLWTVQLKLEK